ncbi:MAG: putative membrane protein [Crocinitomicaceae bacterium]|jgi:uncharacterized membrane protein
MGVVGFLLPILVFFQSRIMDDFDEILPSISNYYHTSSQDTFVGILCIIAITLFVYKGPEKDNRKDRIASFIASMTALGVPFFPTSCVNVPWCIELEPNWTQYVHVPCAIILFSTFGYIAYALFTNSGTQVKDRKRVWNDIYVICAWTIWASIYAMIAISIGEEIDESYTFQLGAAPPVFVLECIALAAFVITWLVKGEVVLRDKPVDIIQKK